MRAPPKTDCWRKTYHKGVVDTAPFHWQKVTGNFRVQVKISGTFSECYHKAGIMVRLDDKNWIMTGMELYNDRLHHSTSRTIDYTDWSLAQLPHNAEKAGIWFCFKRVGTTYECYYSFDAVKWILTRLGHFTARPVLYVGVCCASPRAEDFRATFDYYTCQTSGYM